MSLSWRRFIWRSWKNVFEVWELFWSSLRSLRTFEYHCVLLCTTLLRRRVTELSNLCGLAQVRAVKKSCHAALVFSQSVGVQFWTSVQRKRVEKGVRNWTPLKSKVVPPGGSSFGPFIVANLLRLFQVEDDLTSNSCEWKLELYLWLVLLSTPRSWLVRPTSFWLGTCSFDGC